MKIAITGGIAEGKSQVLQWIQNEGFSVASADQFAKDVFASHGVQRELSSMLGSKESIEPNQLRIAIEVDDQIRREVNRLMHPLIEVLIQESSAIFIEVPLLMEVCLHTVFDRVWVVTCGIEEQRRRIIARDGERALRHLENQFKDHARLAFADAVIRSNLPQNDSKMQVSELLKEYR